MKPEVGVTYIDSSIFELKGDNINHIIDVLNALYSDDEYSDEIYVDTKLPRSVAFYLNKTIMMEIYGVQGFVESIRSRARVPVAGRICRQDECLSGIPAFVILFRACTMAQVSAI
ncbi:MAG: hypothetical protein G5701_02945 [Serratia symbiotica]|nr:hypothetical protein [Serratia symbiotica]